MRLWSSALVIARRDFSAIVLTPTFLLFLLAPLMMVVFAAIGGVSAGQLAQNSGSRERLVAVVPSGEVAAFKAVDSRLRTITGGKGPPQLVVIDAPNHPDTAVARLRANPDVLAILTGSSASPAIAERSAGTRAGRYLALVAETIAREGVGPAAHSAPQVTPRFSLLPSAGPDRSSQSQLGFLVVVTLFMLSLLLASQTVGMLAEEKSNKVIEILAAAAPLEGVFFGKLLGMLGVALLFVTFWMVIIGGSFVLASAQVPDQVAGLVALAPAVGWPMFIALSIIYFFAAFLLLGSVFLGVGAQASSVREIQMLSLPITLFQLGMFSLATAAANSPGTQIAAVAEWLPWSSPFAMAARAATDASLWPHLAALAWQLLWIALTIAVAVRLFRAGVLRSGGSGWRLFRRAPQPVTDRTGNAN